MPLDLVRAFFLGRGFSPDNADYIAKSGCVFRSKIGNSGEKTSSPTITVELGKWRTSQKQTQNGPRTREDWARIWDKKGISENAKTAFYWALFPTRQTYQATDYNWGLISFARAPGTRFDLKIHWKLQNSDKTWTLKGLECGK